MKMNLSAAVIAIQEREIAQMTDPLEIKAARRATIPHEQVGKELGLECRGN